MTENERSSLKRGDIIQNAGSGSSYVVIHSVNGRVLAVQEIEVTNGQEWTLVTERPTTLEDEVIRIVKQAQMEKRL